MTNRLRNLLRTYSFCVGLLISFTCLSRLHAQASFFNFNDNAPDSLAVGINCNLALQGNIPNPIVTSTIGATIVTSMFDETTSGFPFNQLWTAGETAHIYWFVQDNMGHSYTFEYFVHFVDNTPPAFDLTGINDTLYFNSVVQVPNDPPVIPIMDNCTGFTLDFHETTRPDICAAGQFTRTWTATDLSGNKSTFTQTIIIFADVTPPTITFPPQNGSSTCELLATAYPAWLAAQMAAFTAQDPSGIKSLTNNGPASFPPGCKVPLTVTFKATDNCNLMIPTTAVFTTSDTQGPVVTVAPKDTVAYCSPGGNHLTKLNEWIHTHAYLQATDACSAPLSYSIKMNGNPTDSASVVAAFWASFDNPCSAQMVGGHMVNKVSALVRVEFLVKDACGNPTSAGQAVFAAVDTLPPVITGSNSTEQCGGGNDQTMLQNWINAKGNATILDDCSAAFWTNYSFTSSNGQTGTGVFNAGPYPTVVANNCTWYADVTFRASDECGNLSAKTLRFQIIDTQPPVFTGLAPNITVYCPNPLPTVPAATITDNCAIAPAIAFTRVYKDSICNGSYTVLTTWKATDDCGNTATITQNIFVRDTTRPVFTLVPPGLLVRCDTFVLPPVPVQGMNINATDLCSPVDSITTKTVSMQDPNPALCGHYSYTIIRTFTATDQCANTQTTTQLISVIDNLPPVPGGVLDTTALCSALIPFPAPPPIAVDACSGPTTPPEFVNTETIPGGCAGQYTLKLHWVTLDVCGNQTQFVQLVHVIDTIAPTLSNIPPNITVECNAIPAAPNTATFNGVDNCAAGVTITKQESEIRNPDLSSCDHWTNYTLRREWTATDDCGNARKYTQNIQIEDTTPPALVALPAFSLPTDMDQCGKNIPIPAPVSVFDICSAGSVAVLLKDTISITAPPGPINTTPVDTMVFHFSTPNLPPNQPATTNVSLTISIDQADVNNVTEYFNIYGESGPSLGPTAVQLGPLNCVSSTTVLSLTPDQFNNWASDGDLVITLVPNDFGSNAINPTCGPNSRVRMQVGYTYSIPQVPIALTYSLDGAPAASFPPAGSTFLAIGTHSVVYTATDCVGNSSTASVQIVVNDTQPPLITAPAPITAYASSANCNATIKLPFPAIAENCDMSGHLMKSSTMHPLTFTLDPDAGVVPADDTLGISGLIPNAIANGFLRIKFKGDNGNQREFFNIFHNAPPPITITNIGSLAGQCQDTVVTTVMIPADTINAWAATGTAIFRVEANTDAGPSFDFDFINPCAPLLPNQTDGVSRIQVMLQYSYAVVNYTITRNSNAMIVAMGPLQGGQTMVDLTPGVYTVKYTTTDNAGLMGMTTFPLIVLDTVRPVAKCVPSLIIHVNPSGGNNNYYLLQPSEINNGSMDNCSGTNLTYSLSQDTFRCSQAGSNFIVTMTVRDTSGNTSTCATVVSVQNAMPVPSYNSVCEGDTLFLFANPPMPGLFSYMWTGPSLISPDPNPVIPNAMSDIHGVYTVKITGATGCTATGSVTVNFANLNVPDITISGGTMSTHFCQGQNITLNTPTYPGNGSNVSYLWYQQAPIPILLGTTMLNTFTINQPPPGVYQYFVKVKIGECLTPNSIIAMATVYARPPAIVKDDVINVCAGGQLMLGTAVSGPGLTYLWMGPGGTYTDQNPLVSSAVTQGYSGIYILKTFQNGCESIPPDTTLVNVMYTPPKPQIGIMSFNICVGNTVYLTISGAGAPTPNNFEWMDPSLNIIPNSNNDTLTIPNITTASCGNYRVRTSFFGCYSAWSDPFYICPDEYPVVTASPVNPLCQDSTLRLTATGSQGNLTWCWTQPNGSPIYLQNPVLTPGHPGLYQVVGKTIQGCADTASVLVVGSVAPVIDTIANNAPVCADGMTAACLIPTFSSIDSPFTFIWTRNGLPLSTELTLCFTPVGAGNNGPYTFVVKDKYGCPSAPKTVTVNVQAVIAPPMLSISPNSSVCAGSSVTLVVTNSGAYNGNSQFHWVDPLGNILTTTSPQLVLLGVTATQAGDYKVFVSQGVCQSPNSNVVTLVVKPIPAAPIPTSNQPVCVGADLTFNVANPIMMGATYTWAGPVGFSPMQQNPSRPNATLSFEGTYTVQVAVAGCVSAPGTILVDILSLPNLPTITASPSAVCLEQLPILGDVRVSSSSQTLNAIYTWIDFTTKDTIFNSPPTSFVLNYANLPDSLLTPGMHKFQVSAWFSEHQNQLGCSSALSNIVSVQFDTIPDNVAQCDTNHIACVSLSIPLNAVHPSGNTTGHWNSIGVPFTPIVNPDSSAARFGGAAFNTYHFTWSLSSGSCHNFSVDTLDITVAPPEKANAGADTISICDATNFSLNAVQGIFSHGTWSQMGQIGVTIADVNEPHTLVSGLNPGNRYFFVWTLADIGCGLSSDTLRVDYYTGKPNITGSATVCTGENCTLLTTQSLQTWEQGIWTSQNGNLSFDPPYGSTTDVCGLQPGENIVYWTINKGACGSNSRDDFSIQYEIFPQANPDFVSTPFGTAVPFSVLTNDILPLETPTVDIIAQPSHGTIIGAFEDGTGVYRPFSGYTGTDFITYRICNPGCGATAACSFTNVTFTIGPAGDCFVPTIITPNGDGLNDVFKLPPECYLTGEGQDAHIEVTIFNQWGDYVYHSTNFVLNVDSWDGTNHGDQLPAGTYYYVVKFDGETSPKAGFLLLQR